MLNRILIRRQLHHILHHSPRLRQSRYYNAFFQRSSSILQTAPHRDTLPVPEQIPEGAEPFIHDYTRARFISTLDPSRLTPSDSQSLANKPYVALCPLMLWPRPPSSGLDPLPQNDMFTNPPRGNPYTYPYVSFVGYSKDRHGVDVPFPKSTRGFFYYHRPTGTTPTAGHIRFRITQSADPASWSSGRDLYLPNGYVWKKQLMTIIGTHPKLSALRTLLLADKLISPELVAKCEQIVAWRRQICPNVLLNGLEQPFWTSFSAHDRGQFAIIGRDEHKYARMRSFFRDLRSQPSLDPYSGSAFCQFELHNPPSSRNTRRNARNAIEKNRPPPSKLVVRVLKIVDPVSCIIPDYDGFVNEPRAGQLMTMGLGDAKKPWMYNVDTNEVSPKHRATPLLSIWQLREELIGLRLLLDYHTVDR